MTLRFRLACPILAALLWSPAMQAQTRPNPAGLTAAMIAPCEPWLTVRSSFSHEPTDLSNLDFALSIPPYHPAEGGPYNLASTRMFIAEREREIPILQRRDEIGMRATIGMVLRGADYWDRLAWDFRFLCLLYVRRHQLTGQAALPLQTPAEAGYPGS
jgi:hypothetical protein